MSFRKRDHHPDAPGRFAGQAFDLHGKHDESKVDAPFVKRPDLRLRREVLEEDLDAGNGLVEETQRPAQETPMRLGVDSDDELLRLLAGRLARQSDGAVALRQDVAAPPGTAPAGARSTRRLSGRAAAP
jgi:hypothetical protein